MKSPAEIAYVRKAGGARRSRARRGASRWPAPAPSRATSSPPCRAPIFRGGGDDPANEFIIGSGHDALLCRYLTGRRKLEQQDQLTLEFAGVYRHYHACLMRTIPIGEPPARQRRDA